MELNELIVRIRDMSDKDLIVLGNELKIEISKIDEAYVEEVSSFSTENFDPNSYWGSKKIGKTAKKYAEKRDGPSFILELIEEELSKRENLYTQEKYSSQSNNYSKKEIDEFLKSEEIKTMAYKSDLIDNGYDLYDNVSDDNEYEDDEIDENADIDGK